MKFLVCCILGSIFLGSVALANEFDDFHNANEAYDKGDYEAAIHNYEDLISKGFESSDLHFNLANAYFRAAKLGSSIFHFRRALELSPRDGDIKFNLAFAREKVADQVENREPLTSRLWGVWDGMSEKENLWLLSIFVVALFACGIFALCKNVVWMAPVRNIAAVGVILFAMGVLHHSFFKSGFGVVSNPEAKVYSGVGTDKVVLFVLHEGVEFKITDELEDGWIRILLSDGKQGWFKSDGALLQRIRGG